MSLASVLWLIVGGALGALAGWFLAKRRAATALRSGRDEIDRLQAELTESLAVIADREARIATLEAELEFAPESAPQPREAKG